MKGYDPNLNDLDSYRNLSVRVLDPAKLELFSKEDFRWEGHHVELSLDIREWPNDSNHFHDAVHFYLLVLNSVRSLCEGHYCGVRSSDSDDIPF